MNNVHEALEVCLNDLEQGAGVESVLSRYPLFTDELRPVLDAAVQAKGMSVPAPSQDVVKRNRAKVLQRAAQMREAEAVRKTRRFWLTSLRLAAAMLAVFMVALVSGTGLVRAASSTLPGDNLYPVKRTWEGVRLLLAFDAQKRETLELEYGNKRLEELSELFAMGRSARVDFTGYVTRQNADEWRVAGIPVLITAQTRLPDEQVIVGAAVRVRGRTQGDGSVITERIQLLSPGANIPVVDDDSLEEDEHEEQDQAGEDNPGKGFDVEATETLQPQKTSFEGVVSAMENHLWVVNGIVVNVRNAEVRGTPRIGAVAKVEGYFNSSGVFIAEKVEFKDDAPNSGSGSGSNNNNNGNNDNDDNDDNDNDSRDNDNDDD